MSGLHGQVLPNLDVRFLDEQLLLPDGAPRVLPARMFAEIPWVQLRIWLHKQALYGVVTKELVKYLMTLIGDRTAIEIGSGTGVLGKALGIPITDSRVQERPDVAFLYKLQGQPTIRYGASVEKLEALEAVEKYRPQVVVGSWLTQFSDGSRMGSMYGVDEEALLEQVELYIMFGSIRNHGAKAICGRPHQVIQEPWMWSRAEDSALFVWEGGMKR
jgi:hypothetical protein